MLKWMDEVCVGWSRVDWTIWDSNPRERGRGFLSSLNLPKTLWGLYSFLFNKKHYSFPGIKRLEREIIHLS